MEPHQWALGDRVRRQVDVHDAQSGFRYGTVVGIAEHLGTLPPGPWAYQYAVQWDGEEREESGFFWWGIEPIPAGAAAP